MNLKQARFLVQTLQAAVAAAEAQGTDEIDLQSQLQAMDDAARADLDAAIKEAQRAQPSGG